MIEGRSLYVESAEQALSIWAEYRIEGAMDGRRVGPRGLERRAPLKGIEISQAVARFVEETPGYRGVEKELRRRFGLSPVVVRYRGASVSREVFEGYLALGLPREFRGPHEELCEAELEELMRAQAAASMAEIDARYRARYPGMVRG